MAFAIKKTSGETEPFDPEKFKRSLMRPGASPEIANKILQQVLEKLKTGELKNSDQIFDYALANLSESNPNIAMRYNLKKALLQFGPTGFPFEQYVALIFREKGFQAITDQIVKGWCVDHEIDVIIKREATNWIVECKYHNAQNIFSEVQIPLYVQARFQDVQKTWTPDTPGEKLESAWAITNTRFTKEAIKYANCAGMRLTSWDYPKGESLSTLIDTLNLHPITALLSLNKNQKRFLLEHGFILCRDVHKNIDLLRQAHLSDTEIKRVISECEKE